MKILTKTATIAICLNMFWFCIVSASSGNEESGLIAYQEQTVTISGRVNGSEGEVLPGASVFIRSLNLGVTSDINGLFSLSQVPVGTHVFEISYIGYEAYSREITVDGMANIDLGRIVLNPSANQLGEVIITGSIEGQQRAYNQQKNADQIKTIVSADLINQFPDINVGEALQRVAGVNIERDNGEGANIRIRGTPNNFVNVTLDGAQLPTTDGDNRTESLDLIPAELLASMEITKALIPEQDGDAIGGSVNLQTPTARSQKGRLSGTVAGGYADIFQRGSFRSKLKYEKRFADDKFGMVVSGSYYETVNGEERFEGDWRKRRVGEEDNVTVLDELTLRPLLNLRQRIGVGITFDYKFNQNSMFYTSVKYNSLNDENERYRIRLRTRGAFNETGNPFVAGITDPDGSIENGSSTRFRRDMRDDRQTRENITFNVGGEHLIANSLKVDYGYNLSRSERESFEERAVFRAENLIYDIDLSDPDFPQFIPRNFDTSDYSQYQFGAYQRNLPSIFGGFNQTLFANAALPFRLGSKVNGEIKSGAKLRLQETFRTENNIQYAEFDGLYTMDQVVGDEQGTIFDGRYDMGAFPSPSRALTHFRDNFDLYIFQPGESLINTASNTYVANEDVRAWYSQFKLDFGKLSMVGGVRFEETYADYEANIIELRDGSEAAIPTEGEQYYSFWLPSLSLKYEVQRNFNLRASYFRSFARPNFIDIVPREQRNFADAELFRGNPNLLPASADNFDVLGEYYFSTDGTISLGAYYKRIENFIFEQTSIIEDDPIFENFNLIQPVNGDVADVFGAEFTFAKKFTFLPGWLSGFGFYGNYTYTHSSSSFVREREIDGEIVVQRRDDVPLVGQADHTWNAALYYDYKKFTIRGALNYNDRFIQTFDVDPFFDRFREERYQLDANASYRINDNLTVFIEAQNLLDNPVVEFQERRSQVTNREIYGWTARFGVNFKF